MACVPQQKRLKKARADPQAIQEQKEKVISLKTTWRALKQVPTARLR